MATEISHMCIHSESLLSLLWHFRKHTILQSDDSERNFVSSEATFDRFQGR